MVDGKVIRNNVQYHCQLTGKIYTVELKLVFERIGKYAVQQHFHENFVLSLQHVYIYGTDT